jgi:hypothetical protein
LLTSLNPGAEHEHVQISRAPSDAPVTTIREHMSQITVFRLAS